MDSILAVIKEGITSKKFVMALAGAVSAAALRIGLDLPTDTVGLIVGPIVVYIVAQGWADRGKEAAKTQAVAALMHQSISPDAGVSPTKAVEVVKNT